MNSSQPFSSKKYWEKRYSSGGNSGAGSYNKLARFKAAVLNEFVKDNDINTVTELGVGDGNQLALAKYPEFIGLDVSTTSINTCKKLFADDPTKRFELMGRISDFLRKKSWKADLTLSLDVIFHLVEDVVFDKYMNLLFDLSNQYVIIYSSNEEIEQEKARHVKDRVFTDWIEVNRPNWKLVSKIKNKYPLPPNTKPNDSTSRSDFYIFEKKSLK